MEHGTQNCKMHAAASEEKYLLEQQIEMAGEEKDKMKCTNRDEEILQYHQSRSSLSTWHREMRAHEDEY